MGIDDLHSKLHDKTVEITAALTDVLIAAAGFDAFDVSSLHAKMAEVGEWLLDRWEETVEMELSPPDPKTPIQRLLRERHDIAELIMYIQDQETEDWIKKQQEDEEL